MLNALATEVAGLKKLLKDGNPKKDGAASKGTGDKKVAEDKKDGVAKKDGATKEVLPKPPPQTPLLIQLKSSKVEAIKAGNTEAAERVASDESES